MAVDERARENSTHDPVHIDRVAKAPCVSEATEQLTAAGRTPVYPVEFRSQFGEDAMIWRLCAGQLNGFFIEVGAFDGYTYSATYGLESIGWDGLLIEAIPEHAAQCAARRPHSRVVHAALGAEPGGEAQFTVTEDGYGGMFSHVHGTVLHKKRLTRVQSRTVTVPRTTMNELLRDHRGDIDAAVIDVEGSELPLLEGFDLETYRPKVLLIEDNTRGSDAALSAYMSRMPYAHVAWLKVNRVYVREDLAAASIERLSRIIDVT